MNKSTENILMDNVMIKCTIRWIWKTAAVAARSVVVRWQKSFSGSNFTVCWLQYGRDFLDAM